MSKKKIACIINPTAANNKWIKRKKLNQFLHKHIQGQIFDAHRDKAQTVAKARSLSRTNDILIAAGGDGTVADVIQGIQEANRGMETALAVLPLGSGNAFRKSLGIPLNIKKALQLLEHGRQRPIDLIDIEGQAAAFASIGATAQITHKKHQHDTPGLIGHLKAAQILFRLPQIDMEVEMTDGLDESGNPFDHRTIRLGALDCVISKTNYFGYDWKVAPLAVDDDGYIDITFFQISPFKYALSFPLIYLGTFQKKQPHFKAKLAVFRGQELYIQYHGENLGKKSEIHLAVRPGAQMVITR